MNYYEISKGVCDIFNGVTTIDDYAFKDHYAASDIKEIKFPDTLKSIGESAFEGCNHLTSIRIPKSVESIGVGAFCSCHNVESIEVDPENPWFKSLNNCCLSKDGKRLVFGCKSSSIPNTVEKIENRAFEGMGLEQQISIPNSVTHIGSFAFAYGILLNTIILPKNLQIIGEGAFDHCDELGQITIPGTVDTIGNRAFLWCTKLSNVTIEEGVEEIGEDAFCNTKITKLRLPDSVRTIGEFSFYNCHHLTSLDIPCSVKNFGGGAFLKTHIRDIYLSAEPDSYKALVKAFTQDKVFNRFPAHPVLEELQQLLLAEGTLETPLSPYDNITFHVPEQTASAYKENPFFSKFKIATF